MLKTPICAQTCAAPIVTWPRASVIARGAQRWNGGVSHGGGSHGNSGCTMKACATREGKAVVCVPEVALLAQIRADFSLPWSAVEAFERDGPALDTSTAETAAREVGLAEDRLAYSGEPVGTGFLEDPGWPRIRLEDWTDPARVIADLVGAVEALDRLTVPGPYEAVLSADRYYAYLSAANRGYPVPRHTKNIIADVHRSLVMQDGGALFSMRGGDFILTVGGDLSVGYRSHDRDALHLFCVETVAPQTLEPDAVCVLEGDRANA